jgi:hypothetical protein
MPSDLSYLQARFPAFGIGTTWYDWYVDLVWLVGWFQAHSLLCVQLDMPTVILRTIFFEYLIPFQTIGYGVFETYFPADCGHLK